MLHYQILDIGSNRGAPRVWLQDQILRSAGFNVGNTYTVTEEGDQLTLTVSDAGERVVSPKPQRGKVVPAVDLNSHKILRLFEGLTRVRIIAQRTGVIVITSLNSDRRRKERKARVYRRLANAEPLEMASVSHGGGIMCHALHHGLRDSGHDVHLAFANEIRPELIDHASKVNDSWEQDTIKIAAPLQEFAFDFEGVKLSQVDIVDAGLPCSGASKSGRAKRGMSLPEAHPEVGHLMVAFLALVARTNPLLIVLENVVPYLNTGSAWQFKNQLKDWGYEVHELIFRGSEFGALEDRERAVLIAVTDGISFDLADLERSFDEHQTFADIQDPVPDNSSKWSPMEGLRSKQVRDEASGKNFKMQIVSQKSQTIPTIGKGYQKNRSTEPKLQHPDNPELLRLLTPAEHARAKRIPETLVEGHSDTVAHEVLGQSVIHPAFAAIGRLIGHSLWRWASMPVAA
ncbi:DNA cytosine methyltransferase [Nitrogeniibacter aestuarii]|uniref:DNA cytosine methyltransferase n=1 Tax=Nitrogeniibacter aestuarii TaxID=2815343 RepID=UPI001E431BEB|nr:DNA cytosine methyltransferase [Nitrogeniibacter aestuarii]